MATDELQHFTERPAAGRARVTRNVAAAADERLTARIRQRREAVAEVTSVAVRTLDERGQRLCASAAEAVRAYDDVGFAPPLFHVAGRSETEKPYNRLLGWLLTPSRDHGAARQALRLFARKLGHDVLAADLENEERAARVVVRSESRWPEDVESSKTPDLLVITDCALLLIESKLWSPESGDQYGPYKQTLHDLARLLPLALVDGTCSRLFDGPHGVERPARFLMMTIGCVGQQERRCDGHRAGDRGGVV